MCLAEVAHFLERRLGWGAESGLLLTLAAGDLTLTPVEPSDLERMAELVTKYRDLPLGSTDASIVASAERLDVTTIATLDRRHFSAVRPAHVEAFELVP
jgi:uncharacterized protein